MQTDRWTKSRLKLRAGLHLQEPASTFRRLRLPPRTFSTVFSVLVLQLPPYKSRSMSAAGPCSLQNVGELQNLPPLVGKAISHLLNWSHRTGPHQGPAVGYTQPRQQQPWEYWPRSSPPQPAPPSPSNRPPSSRTSQQEIVFGNLRRCATPDR